MYQGVQWQRVLSARITPGSQPGSKFTGVLGEWGRNCDPGRHLMDRNIVPNCLKLSQRMIQDSCIVPLYLIRSML
jgi:hypothetical protein